MNFRSLLHFNCSIFPVAVNAEKNTISTSLLQCVSIACYAERVLLFLSDELLTECCRTDDLMPRLKYPCPLPSSKPCGPQSSGAERRHLSLSARWILDDQEVSPANQVVVAARRRWHGGGPPLELIEPGARKTSTGTTWPFQRLASSPWCV